MEFPSVQLAEKLLDSKPRIFIGAYGFEERSLGWVKYQEGYILNGALLFRYKRPKGRNRIKQLKQKLFEIGVQIPEEISYQHGARFQGGIEDIIENKLKRVLNSIDEIVIDISAMSKLLILICLCKLRKFTGTVRIVYSEAESYAPTLEEYEKLEKEMEIIARFPSRGVETIVRTKCLSSIRMQGQPVSLIAFTSFNEQLVRHMLGTISPHRLLFINGRPPTADFSWRELATQEIHRQQIEEYSIDNPTDGEGLLLRVANTLDYKDTIARIKEIYDEFGIYERIICAATGSKMQTVGLFFSKIAHPDIHIEYPTPDSYFVTGMSKGVRNIHEVIIPNFSEFLRNDVAFQRSGLESFSFRP